METFLVYMKKKGNSLGEAVFLREGFSFNALIFNLAWLLLNRLWVQFIAFSLVFVFIIELASKLVLDPLTAFTSLVLLLIYIGMSSSDFIRAKLEKTNYELKEVILAYTLDEAKYRFLASQLKE